MVNKEDDDDDKFDRTADRNKRKKRISNKERDRRRAENDRIDGGDRGKPRKRFRLNQGFGEASSYGDDEAEEYFEEYNG